MDKRDILLTLQNMFEDKEKDEPDFTIESKQIDKNNYLTLITRDNEDFIGIDPDYEAFIALLKYHNTKELNYIVKKFNDNKVKIFTEYSDEQRKKLLEEMKDLQSRLSNSNQRNIVFVEMMIVDWANKIL
ncbi:MAG TPA: hypothetical protein DHW61_15830 [Lachnoclostridium phytofermentans]|uniref:Uncharacterized protein n=1 Tax=Lachnoclostridium phytofermentans TaxID=66219 RepID=A0A3D2X9M5_9FIRM|nr:hypothetical protein [Lachnoclostridium sp.]HCL03850.1 hypothetical protein [Lachnoclostridium phytofermentans]